MIHCTSAARHNKSIVYKIAPKRKQRYCTISNGCIPRWPSSHVRHTNTSLLSRNHSKHNEII